MVPHRYVQVSHIQIVVGLRAVLQQSGLIVQLLQPNPSSPRTQLYCHHPHEYSPMLGESLSEGLQM